MKLFVTISLVVLASLCPNFYSSPDYFPPHFFAEDPRDDQAAAQVVASYLEALSEPPLSAFPDDQEVYRLVWIPAFERVIVVRILHETSTSSVRIGLHPEGGSGAGPSVREFEIDEAAWHRLQENLRRAQFWTSLENEPTPQDIVVLDASQWILEGIRGGHYKAVQRTPPDVNEDQEFIDLALAFLETAGFDLKSLGLVSD